MMTGVVHKDVEALMFLQDLRNGSLPRRGLSDVERYRRTASRRFGREGVGFIAAGVNAEVDEIIAGFGEECSGYGLAKAAIGAGD